RAAATIPATERRATTAEPETFDRLLAQHLADRVGATFDGHISGVTRAGLFVKLDETGADGFIPARTIGSEYFRYHEDKHALVGNASGATHRLGDRVTVRLVEAAPVAGALRFELLSEGLAATAARREKADGRPSRNERGRKASRRDKNRGKTNRRCRWRARSTATRRRGSCSGAITAVPCGRARSRSPRSVRPSRRPGSCSASAAKPQKSRTAPGRRSHRTRCCPISALCISSVEP